MRVLGVTNPLAGPVADFRVGHGEHPDETLWRSGWVVVRPLRADLVDGEIQVILSVRSRRQRDAKPTHAGRGAARGNAHAAPYQRIAAYALVRSPRGILGTVCSARTPAPGVWMLPGGGVDEGESPAAAVVREVHEESGQAAQLDHLLAVQSERRLRRLTGGRLQDYHALRIFYAATCPAPTEPVVHDVTGTTERSAWVEPTRWRRKPWAASVRALIGEQDLRLLAG